MLSPLLGTRVFYCIGKYNFPIQWGIKGGNPLPSKDGAQNALHLSKGNIGLYSEKCVVDAFLSIRFEYTGGIL